MQEPTIEKPRVSVVIVNWKTRDLLSDCLRSIVTLDRGAQSFELIVVDNHSEDGSVEMVKDKFLTVLLIENKDNVGFARGCNQAIRLANGKHVLLLNPDTVITEDAISRMADFLESQDNIAAVGPKVLNPDGTLQLACRRSFPSLSASFYRLTYLSRLFPKNKTFARYNLTHESPDEVLEVDALSGSCMMVKRSVIDKIGLLDEDIFMHGEDLDWCWRIKETGLRIMYIPNSVVYHIHGASSQKRPIATTINFHKGMQIFYKKHLAKKYWAPFNYLVYAAIWSRAGLLILVKSIRGFLAGS